MHIIEDGRISRWRRRRLHTVFGGDTVEAGYLSPVFIKAIAAAISRRRVAMTTGLLVARHAITTAGAMMPGLVIWPIEMSLDDARRYDAGGIIRELPTRAPCPPLDRLLRRFVSRLRRRFATVANAQRYGC